MHMPYLYTCMYIGTVSMQRPPPMKCWEKTSFVDLVVWLGDLQQCERVERVSEAFCSLFSVDESRQAVEGHICCLLF